MRSGPNQQRFELIPQIRWAINFESPVIQPNKYGLKVYE